MASPENERMIFIVGNSRSGTTMLGRMLGRGTEVYNYPELHLFGRFIAHGMELLPQSRQQAINTFSWLADVTERKIHAKRRPDLFHKYALEFTGLYYVQGKDAWDLYHDFLFHDVQKRGKTIPCEDLPSHVFKLEQIIRKFPQARIIHIVRDARDVLLSQKKRRNRRKMGADYLKVLDVIRYRMNYHPLVISKLWNSAVSAGLAFRDNPAVLTIRYEDLLKNSPEVLKLICDHCQIDFCDEMLDIPHVGSSTRPDNPDKRGIDTSRTGNWKTGGLSSTEIAICERINAKLLVEMGYALSGQRPTFSGLLFSYLSLPIKGVLSLLLNLDRAKGLREYIKKRFC